MGKHFWNGFFSVFEESVAMRSLILSCTLVIIVNAAYQIYSTYSTKTVTIDSRFACTSPDSNGLETICRQYTQVHGVR
jgi:hypothetical protein